MLLKPVSFLDIAVFLLFLTFYLIRHSYLLKTTSCGFQALPFLFVSLPAQLIKERCLTSTKHQLPFTRRTTLFQDAMVRCLRWAFTNLPSDVGRLFFLKGVSLPFLRFRMLRSGYFLSRRDCPRWVEVNQNGLKGLWIAYDTIARPDLLVYYVHGGGFAMGSSYFYLEFLMTWVSVLKEHGFKNPVVFALEYTLIPDECYPYQLHETLAGYNYVLSRSDDPNIITISGDSAGALLVLSLLLYLGSKSRTERPAFAALISPWTHLMSDENRNTASDYLDSDKLNEYGREYARSADPSDPFISPGDCRDAALWTASLPRGGIGFYYGGSEELFGPGIKELSGRLNTIGKVICREDGNVHSWPVAAMFLETETAKRRKGLNEMSSDIAGVILCDG
ncbi:alpha/beta-hydrolase [Wilcoxina mikolae CBS 423.85]|nr:alpha/beta-hydrolase [Wilcoxina mikolae CBS 423.85]